MTEYFAGGGDGNMWITNTANTSGSYTYTYPVTITSGGTIGGGGGGGGYVPAPPREPTVLEWLDAEVERTCALARS